MIFKISILYFFIISIISVFLTIYDKYCAVKHKRRISENTIMLLAVLGGSIFIYFTMKLIRHKTRKNKFMIGLPIIFLLQVMISYLFLKLFIFS